MTIDESNDLHQTFIQNVSHELRTPLSIILGYVELLREGDLGLLAPEQEEAVFLIANRAYELRSLVERIGVLLSAQAHQHVTVPLNLNAVVEEVIAAQREAAEGKGLALEASLAPDLPEVKGDNYHLRLALECLVENALKFTPEGGEVTVRTYVEDDEVCVAVSDTGIGMAKEELVDVWSGFFQADGSTTRNYGGNGLGLTVVKTVVDEHEGQVDVESDLGEGSRFTLRLPQLTGKLLDEPEIDQSEGDGALLQRILIVDDEENVALTLREGLRGLPNCEVFVTTSGEEALKLCEQEPFHLMITDYRMPKMDGMSLALQVREMCPQTSIMVITAYGSDELHANAAQASIQRVLDKPVGLAEVRNVVMEALGRMETAEGAARKGAN
jgi:CheY-like chemotaxis protein/anti-sigma regulatory factor (Ser/Thr protein kinase)